MDFYHCSLKELAKCYYDCQTWIGILKAAQRDEEKMTGKEAIFLGLDNCDLAPYLSHETTDKIFRLNRSEMVANLLSAKFGRPTVIIPPATIIEYVRSAFAAAGLLKKYLDEFDLYKQQTERDFQELLLSRSEKIRRMADAGSGVPGLKRLKEELERGSLSTLTSAIGSPAYIKEVIRADIRSDPKAREFLSSRRTAQGDSDFATLIDIANCDTFLAVNHVMGSENHIFQMTTSGNLTLRACEMACPQLEDEKKPFRNFATPYLRIMLRQEEPSKASRLLKMKLGELSLREFMSEAEKVPELYAVTRAQIDTLDPNAVVGVSKRLNDAVSAWLNLCFFPYLRGLKDAGTQTEYPQGSNINTSVSWVEQHRDDLQKHAQIPRQLAKELAVVGGFDTDNDFIERFVPNHPEALRIVQWLKQ